MVALFRATFSFAGSTVDIGDTVQISGGVYEGHTGEVVDKDDLHLHVLFDANELCELGPLPVTKKHVRRQDALPKTTDDDSKRCAKQNGAEGDVVSIAMPD